jgi:hypothetical protein
VCRTHNLQAHTNVRSTTMRQRADPGRLGSLAMVNGGCR